MKYEAPVKSDVFGKAKIVGKSTKRIDGSRKVTGTLACRSEVKKFRSISKD